ncbi:MAG: tRNA uridine-5-carboxymethylaminomethyl(34) synthesis enzyme MnmG [Candidatus Marinimicrobia bacterium]|jgi:tRNA uridine 5-carboxymethylaminomethyl modification enzyme|nr:tRNA uridine-5-carboxymethylaminomethyl(34) synthesis enzyme MnmG [Candidatus Neomarinimicrobiota bacterium]MBT3683646.1 tRNA uridine-5-carboxymethylaminomethyl(34) synthesis enzyme MnmG [Candidatus Neomarinimicrobiota bacterium]MBT3760425.1 tRNA uridine-5-carboxymethylaminomethyl(34) synthesis enzyme MnmG [Candidatus Neomarinimicrobiota bacterium]MBT3896497.1 tRNA uridine-5-carboxymethylaminomethyl(34) synthesis enzyme MnmG [Candidatus Neomarinimicrobiota bacterium]MBT4173589.1 tRNA uridine
MNPLSKKQTVVICGGGHAGIEASLAVARLGINTILVTLDANAIGRMSCNPAIGGLAKGHLVKEIDALGGQMGVEADKAGIQFKMLNKSKGRAVWGPRAQMDKVNYARNIRKTILLENNIRIVQGEAVDIKVDNQCVSAVILKDGTHIPCRAVIIPSGTFLDGKIHIGNKNFPAGRFGEKPSIGLTQSLKGLGFKFGRLKTGTPPRILSNSIDYSLAELSDGDKLPTPFSTRTPRPFKPKNLGCHIVNTNSDCHDILYNSLSLSPMYSGIIKGVGPRYCPSVEDKIVRFKDRKSHQLFLEPEWEGSKQIYVNGFSTSMPEEVQKESLRMIPALRNVEFIRPGYAIEYDYFIPSQLKSTLESKEITGLFLAGQINGTSGYEEAAAQGLIAGINAALLCLQKNSFSLTRFESYIGVLIDDIVTKDIDEPYRMFTSRAEFRLSLRPDNADIRLTQQGRNIGLVTDAHFDIFQTRLKNMQKIEATLEKASIDLGTGIKKPAIKVLKQPLVTTSELATHVPGLNTFLPDDLFTVETDIKYTGYVDREQKRIEQINKIENISLPVDIDYLLLQTLSMEAREKLQRIRPETLGQASRIAGVSPSDILNLNIMLK